ncbi:MipA/OmpV family protein [Sphingomonas sp. R-74633]|uniref:MipA/OmpV family protein n=1 Tax=Sphingomonas sp. R-74633 TaxID=2751188 RepID=UPI0015D396FF|nr:MipA/OmpV family protein [Sphingomonas sp. R-74633]NYT39398.1 MipA/OmpV family protein [Sphingomonas sp. R-74633]
MVRLLALAPLLVLALPAHAQEQDGTAEKAPRRYRVSLGPQFSPAYPGEDKLRLSPLIDLGITRGDTPFVFEAADESFEVPMLDDSGFQIGGAANLQGARRRKTAGIAIDEVGTTVELGGYMQYWLAKPLRFRVEARQGINGHGGLTGMAGFDYVARNGDKWLFAIGPRVTLSDAKYRRAYFEVTPTVAARTGLAVYRADGSAIQAYGANATTTFQFSKHWGIYAYAKYDRLTGDGADSPITRTIGSRDQFSGGAALSFTFGRGVR